MTLTKFKTPRRMLRFDKRSTWNVRLRSDKLAGFCFLNSLVNNLQSCYLVGPTVTVDEQLGIYSFRERCRYIPSKPARYALKFWLVNDSASAVTQLIILLDFANVHSKGRNTARLSAW